MPATTVIARLASRGAFCIVLLSLLLEGCSRSPRHEPITLSIVDQQWTTANFHQAELQELQRFTRANRNPGQVPSCAGAGRRTVGSVARATPDWCRGS